MINSSLPERKKEGLVPFRGRRSGDEGFFLKGRSQVTRVPRDIALIGPIQPMSQPGW